MAIAARCSVQTPFAPSNAPGAIAIIQVHSTGAPSIDEALSAMGLPAINTGAITVRRVLDVDECVVARWGESCVHLMPHAGKAVMRAMLNALRSVGIETDDSADGPRDRYPEADDLIDACLCDTLSRARSPRAVDVLCEHADRWRGARGDILEEDSPEARALQRLITPPIVVGWGPPNVGKSSLLNALARRAVSIVADQPGTTRDHVGVTLELDGLAVRWIDAPGVGAIDSPEDRAAMALAREMAMRADLVVLMGDAESGLPDPPPRCSAPTLRAATRNDLGAISGADLSTSLKEERGGRGAGRGGRGVADLAIAARRALVGDGALSAPGLWRFSPHLPDRV